MNPEKMEFIMFGSHQQRIKCITKSIKVVGDVIELREEIKYLGSWFDRNLNFQMHAVKTFHTAVGNIIKLKWITDYLDLEACKTLVDALVICHLDYSMVP